MSKCAYQVWITSNGGVWSFEVRRISDDAKIRSGVGYHTPVEAMIAGREAVKDIEFMEKLGVPNDEDTIGV